MRYIIIILSIFLLDFGTPAFADKLPDAVMEPYKKYRAAFAERDYDTAQKHAKAAWDAAEDKLGDHKTTGDLAYNYTQLFDVLEYNPELRKAYERSVTLSSLHESQAESIEIQRRVALAQNSLYSNKDSFHLNDLKELDKVIVEYGYLGSTFNAEAIFLRSRYFYHEKQYEKSLDLNEQALDLFKNASPKYPSILFYAARMDRADILKKMDRDLEAALQYQEVMQNVEGELPSDHSYVNKAFASWMHLRYMFEESGLLEQAEQAGLCECWPYENNKDKVVPLKRIPPIFPRNGMTSGHVQLIFDITDEGKPENPRVISSTHRVFEGPALKALDQWVYTKKTEEEPVGARKEISTRITFILTDERGRKIPEPEVN